MLAWSLLRKLRLASPRRFKEGVLAGVRGMTEGELRRLGDRIYSVRVRPLLRVDALRELSPSWWQLDLVHGLLVAR